MEIRANMADYFCDIEILRNEGEFEARVEGITPNIMSLKSDNLEELLEQLTIELEDKLNN